MSDYERLKIVVLDDAAGHHYLRVDPSTLELRADSRCQDADVFNVYPDGTSPGTKQIQWTGNGQFVVLRNGTNLLTADGSQGDGNSEFTVVTGGGVPPAQLALEATNQEVWDRQSDTTVVTEGSPAQNPMPSSSVLSFANAD
ncbi:MAG: hypothetical protein AAF533_30130 [Acidobacteriota bacterium]